MPEALTKRALCRLYFNGAWRPPDGSSRDRLLEEEIDGEGSEATTANCDT